MQDIDKFVEENIEGEPLTTDTVAYAIKRYLRSNFEPPDKRKIGVYEKVMYMLAKAQEENDPRQMAKTLEAIKQWSKVRLEDKTNDEFHQRYIQNETFYNLIKT